jgi:hypothetical protein
MQQLSCKNCPAGKYQSTGAGTYTNCKTCGARLTPSSCVMEVAPPTQQVLVLDQSDARAKATTLETREDAVARVDLLKVQLTTCATTFEEEKAFGASAELAKQAAEEKAAADKAAADEKLAAANKVAEEKAASDKAAAEQKLAATKEAKDAVIDAERLRHVAEIRNSNATSEQCKLDLESAFNVTAVLDHNVNALNTTVAHLEAAKVILETDLETAQAEKETADQELIACKSTTVSPTAAPTVAHSGPASSPASCVGSVSLDVDGNSLVDSTDMIQLFIAVTMRNFGADVLLQHYQARAAVGVVAAPAVIIANVKEALQAFD